MTTAPESGTKPAQPNTTTAATGASVSRAAARAPVRVRNREQGILLRAALAPGAKIGSGHRTGHAGRQRRLPRR